MPRKQADPSQATTRVLDDDGLDCCERIAAENVGSCFFEGVEPILARDAKLALTARGFSVALIKPAELPPPTLNVVVDLFLW